MRQRAMIAIAIATNPTCSSPTSRHRARRDHSGQILELLQEIQRETGTAIVFITHDLG